MRLAQARVGAGVPAAGVCILAGRTLGTGERSGALNASRGLICKSICVPVASVCIRVRAEKCEIFRWPLVRGCANVKVYLKRLNEAAPNGS